MSGGEKRGEGNVVVHFTPVLLRGDVPVLSAVNAAKMLSGLPIILMDTFIWMGNWLSLFWHFCGISSGFNLNWIYF